MTYKEQQRANDLAFETRGKALHTSCVVVPVGGRFVKQMVDGTYNRGLGKKFSNAEIKADKKKRTKERLVKAYVGMYTERTDIPWRRAFALVSSFMGGNKFSRIIAKHPSYARRCLDSAVGLFTTPEDLPVVAAPVDLFRLSPEDLPHA